VVLRRDPITCFQAIEKVVQPEDVGALLTALALFEQDQHRTSLARLVEGMTLHRFFEKPQIGQGWGPELWEEGVQRVEIWAEQHCGASFEELLMEGVKALGIHGIDPLDADACVMWQHVLLKGEPSWSLLAARQLYLCGAPPKEMSILRAEIDTFKNRRENLIKFYGLRDSAAAQRKRARTLRRSTGR
jgi:hypothetical protein